MVKLYSDKEIDAMIKMKFGRLVTNQFHTAYVSNRILGKLFKCSSTKVRELYM